MKSKISQHLFFTAWCYFIVVDSFAFRLMTLSDSVKKEYRCPAQTTLSGCIASKEVRTLNFEIVDHSGNEVACGNVSLSKGIINTPSRVSSLVSGTCLVSSVDDAFSEMARQFIKF